MAASKLAIPGSPAVNPTQRIIRRVLSIPELTVVVAIVVSFLFFTTLDQSMAEPAQFVRLLKQSVFFGVIALGLVYLMMAGEIDLSTGSVAGFSAAVVGVLIVDYGWSEWASLLCALLVAVVIGLFNSFIVLKVGVPSFFATLGTHFLVLGLIQVLLKGRWLFILRLTPILDTLVKPSPVFGIPWTFIVLLGAVLLADFMVRRSVLGQMLSATGANRQAAEVSGINTSLVKTFCFVFVSVCSAIAGFFVMQAGTAADPQIGDGWLLWVVAIAIIGGCSLSGGVGSVLGALLGTILIWIIRLGLGAAQIQTNAQGVVIGVILVAAAILDVVRQRIRNY